MIRQQFNVSWSSSFFAIALNCRCCFHCGTVTGEIFIKKEDLYFAFVDLYVFDQVLGVLVWWALRKLNVEEWLVSSDFKFRH